MQALPCSYGYNLSTENKRYKFCLEKDAKCYCNKDKSYNIGYRIHTRSVYVYMYMRAKGSAVNSFRLPKSTVSARDIEINDRMVDGSRGVYR